MENAPDGRQIRIAIAADHNGIELKSYLISYLLDSGYSVDDRGSHSHEIVDYPFLCVDVAREVTSGKAERGIVIGGSGQGEHIACNKIKGVRAGLCGSMFQVEISRGNNDSNILILAAKTTSNELAKELSRAWLVTPFKGGVHQQRLNQIAKIEAGETLD